MEIAQYRKICEKYFQRPGTTAEALTAKIDALEPEKFNDFNLDEWRKYEKATKQPVSVARVAFEATFPKRSDMFSDDVVLTSEQKDKLSYFRSLRDVQNEVFNERVLNLPAIQALNERIEAFRRKEALKVTVDDVDYVAERIIDVMWVGWELDSRAWLVRVDGKPRLVTTDHGQPEFVDESFLVNKMEEYQKALSQSEQVLFALRGE